MILQPTSEHFFLLEALLRYGDHLLAFALIPSGMWDMAQRQHFAPYDIHIQKGKYITSDHDFLSTRHLPLALSLIDAEVVAKPRPILYSLKQHKETS